MRQSCSIGLALLTIAALACVSCQTRPAASHTLVGKAGVSPAPAKRAAQPAELPAEQAAKAHAHYGAGVIYDVNDDTEAALNEYLQAAKLDPGNEGLILEVSRRLLQAKQLDKALEVLSRAAALPSASGQIFARLGVTYAQLGRAEEAIAANRAAIKKSPDSLAGYQNLVITYLQAKQGEQALGILNQAASQANTGPEFLLGLGELYITVGVQNPELKDSATKSALEVLQRADKVGLSNPALKLMLADHLSALGQTQRASQLYLSALDKLPNVPGLRDRVHAKLTQIYLENKDHQAAAEQLQAILKDDPTNPTIYYYLGSIAAQDKKFAQAAEYLDKVILLKPEFEQAYYELANVQLAAQKTSEALGTLERARQKFPNNYVLEILTANAYTRQKEYSEALRHFTSAEVIARASEPERLNQFFYFQLGAAYERSGDFEQAERCFEKCLQMAPDFSEALNYLGYMLAERGEKLDKARSLIEKAVKAEPKNAAYLDSLGWVLYKLGEPKSALTQILKAVELSEEPDATVYDHLGDIYASLNDREKAREAWSKSLSIEGNEAVRKKLVTAETR